VRVALDHETRYEPLLQVAKDNGAKRALIPIENSGTSSTEAPTSWSTSIRSSFGDAKTVAMKVVGG
jgi:predicted ATP-dependent Lon-type protease